jgi:hypothetical protein
MVQCPFSEHHIIELYVLITYPETLLNSPIFFTCASAPYIFYINNCTLYITELSNLSVTTDGAIQHYLS